MAWMRVDDKFYMHPKVVDAGNNAIGLWVRAGSWSSGNLTNGFIPTRIVRQLGTKRQADALVNAHLWERVEGGYQFHDWNAINPSRAEIEDRREEWRKRQAKHRASRRDSRVSPSRAGARPNPNNPLTPLHGKGDKGAPDGPAAGPEGAAATPPQPADDSNATRLAHLRAQRLPEAWA